MLADLDSLLPPIEPIRNPGEQLATNAVCAELEQQSPMRHRVERLGEVRVDQVGRVALLPFKWLENLLKLDKNERKIDG